MAALSAAKVHSFVQSPDFSLHAFLIYGQDPGLVQEYSIALSQKLAHVSQDIGEIIFLDDNDISNNPDKLSLEIDIVPMFGGQKVVRARTGLRLNASLLEPLIHSTMQSYLVVEAGDLKKNAKLRTLFEKNSHAMALPCYGDDSKALLSLIDDEFSQSNMTFAVNAKQHLQDQLGADRALSRAELKKLLLYAHGQNEITIEDIDAVIGDAAALSLEQIIYACGLGDIDAALSHFDRALDAGHSPQSVLFFLNKHFTQLHHVRGQVDRGDSLDVIVRRLRPPVHFKRQNDFKRQCSSWSQKQLFMALDLITQTTVRCRGKMASYGSLERIFIERLLLNLGRMGRR
ncbi:MAG: DNA polymerase III subunit delta [Pseudomonadota bacterium]